MILDSAVYVEGARSGAYSPGEALEACRLNEGFAWIQLQDPTRKELASVARDFSLPDPLISEAAKVHHRPKLQWIGDTLFVVLKSARYLEKPEAVEFAEIHVFLGPDFILAIRYGEPPLLQDIRQRLEEDPDFLRRGPVAVLYSILAYLVEDYEPVIEGLGNDIDEIEGEVFGGDPDARRIYELAREVLAFLRAVQPLSRMLEHLASGSSYEVDPEISHRFLAVRDQALRASEQAEGFRELLSNILNVSLTLVTVQQNEQVQKISAWAAILIIPTIITGIYGMNFRYMPELNWSLGYPFALVLMLGVSGLLYLWFKRSGWL